MSLRARSGCMALLMDDSNGTGGSLRCHRSMRAGTAVAMGTGGFADAIGWMARTVPRDQHEAGAVDLRADFSDDSGLLPGDARGHGEDPGGGVDAPRTGDFT